MKVKELMDLLMDEDEDMEIGFSYDYGDHIHTQVVSDIFCVRVEGINYSEYHRMNAMTEDEPQKEMVVLL